MSSTPYRMHVATRSSRCRRGGRQMDDRFVRPDGDKIRRLRQGRFWSQDDLATQAKRPKRTIERAEAGERLQRDTLRAIAQALGVPPEELVRSDRAFEPRHDGVQSTSPEPSGAPPSPARVNGRDEAFRKGAQTDVGGGDTERILPPVQGRCSGCGFENLSGVKFCIACGMPLQNLCPSCGAEHVSGAKFCGACGSPLAEQPPALQAQPLASRPQTPLSYTPPHLTDKILTSRSALEGERKLVTVLFADLKGSLELLAECDPEEARAILDPVLERMMDAVHRYEGPVNQVLGDGIMALFGAPVAHEDHAVRACYAAL